jgi:hypothetical protein
MDLHFELAEPSILLDDINADSLLFSKPVSLDDTLDPLFPTLKYIY